MPAKKKKSRIVSYTIDTLPKLSAKEIKQFKSAKLKDEDIDTSDIPELTEEFWKNAKLAIPARKKMISIRVDDDILDWFKTHARGRGYQSRINSILRAYVESQRDR